MARVTAKSLLEACLRMKPDRIFLAEVRGEQLFHGKAQCGTCHPAPFYLDDKMHDLKLERFFEPQVDNGHFNAGDGPIKTFTLRGIKDSDWDMDDSLTAFKSGPASTLDELEPGSVGARVCAGTGCTHVGRGHQRLRFSGWFDLGSFAGRYSDQPGLWLGLGCLGGRHHRGGFLAVGGAGCTFKPYGGSLQVEDWSGPLPGPCLLA